MKRRMGGLASAMMSSKLCAWSVTCLIFHRNATIRRVMMMMRTMTKALPAVMTMPQKQVIDMALTGCLEGIAKEQEQTLRTDHQ